LWFGGVPVLPHVPCGAPSGPPATLRTMPDGRRRAPVASCPDCPPPEIASGRAAFLFDGPVREAIHRMKFRRDRRIADVLGAAMAAIAPPSADGVVWVPLSRARLAERGFDQVLALARSAARRLGLPVLPVLSRVRDAGPQAMRDGTARRGSLAGAFEARSRPPAHALLVDDVPTTGATGAECAATLRASGSARVDLLVAARSVAVPRLAASKPLLSSDGLWSGSVVARGVFPR